MEASMLQMWGPVVGSLLVAAGTLFGIIWSNRFNADRVDLQEYQRHLYTVHQDENRAYRVDKAMALSELMEQASKISGLVFDYQSQAFRRDSQAAKESSTQFWSESAKYYASSTRAELYMDLDFQVLNDDFLTGVIAMVNKITKWQNAVGWSMPAPDDTPLLPFKYDNYKFQELISAVREGLKPDAPKPPSSKPGLLGRLSDAVSALMNGRPR